MLQRVARREGIAQAYGLRDIVRIGEWAKDFYGLREGRPTLEDIDLPEDKKECPRALFSGEKPNDVGEALAMLGVTRSARMLVGFMEEAERYYRHPAQKYPQYLAGWNKGRRAI